MACAKRKQTGDCLHNQCPYPAHSGYECVEIIDHFCEVGTTCPTRDCPFAISNDRLDDANKTFARYYGQDWPYIRKYRILLSLELTLSEMNVAHVREVLTKKSDHLAQVLADVLDGCDPEVKSTSAFRVP